MPLKRWLLQRYYGYCIHPTARIGWSWVFPGYLEMEAHSKIGHFNTAVHLDAIHLESTYL
ncbi:hypothetical protein ZPR_0554 [Zunongwangia profunda SM-A87]|uniref:Uncharacterized protein n=2 Tax=Zunongwangia profunda TaxID=398743 RepID=D5BFG7_ZUNPS|nr:hypothetical protein ZPR_0554 [Zunongwangia profunda SM-A87]